MKYRKLDGNGDYTFGQNAQNFLTDIDAVAQAIKTSLLLLQGEWWEDTSSGLPLFQNILSQPRISQNKIDLIIKDNILNVYGVKGIKDFASNYSNRSYSVSCTIDTQYGSTQITVPLEVAL